jgi:hypothetical protein
MKQSGLFGLSDHLKRLSANGDPLEELVRIPCDPRKCAGLFGWHKGWPATL